MLISVAIPAYNGAEHLRDAIDSVLAQTYRPLEIIVVDDGSTDDTRAVCESYGDCLKYYYQENDATMGAGARARAIAQAKGEWVALLDQDDRWLPRKIARQVRALSNFSDAVIAFTGFHEIDSLGRVTSEELSGGPSGDVFHRLLRRNPYVASSALIKRSVIDEYPPATTDVGVADYDLWLRIAKYHKVVVVDECLTEYRVHEARYSANRRRLAAAVLRTLEQQGCRLHSNCTECRDAFRQGLAFISNVAARACLDQYHEAARSGELAASLVLLKEAIKAAPSRVFLPRQLLAVSKNLVVALIRVIRNGLAAI